MYAVLDVARGLDPVVVGTGKLAPPPQFTLRQGGKVECHKRPSGKWPPDPEAAAARNASGRVALFARVRQDGSLGDAVTLGPTDADLEKAARDAVATWKYSPMKLDRIRVEAAPTIVFEFRRP